MTKKKKRKRKEISLQDCATFPCKNYGKTNEIPKILHQSRKKSFYIFRSETGKKKNKNSEINFSINLNTNEAFKVLNSNLLFTASNQAEAPIPNTNNNKERQRWDFYGF